MLGLLPAKREFLLSGLPPERSSVFTLSYKVPLSPFVVIYCCINEPELN